MGVNLGAAMSPLLCGYIGETYGWHFGFGLATVGMLIGFGRVRAATAGYRVDDPVGVPAAAVGLLWFHPAELLATAVNVFVAAAIVTAAIIAVTAIYRGGLPAQAGASPYPERLRRSLFGFLTVERAV